MYAGGARKHNGIEIRVSDEKSADKDTKHVSEFVGYAVFTPVR